MKGLFAGRQIPRSSRFPPGRDVLLRNPHSILAAIGRRPGDVQEVRLRGGRARGAWKQVLKQAEARGVPVRRVARVSENRRQRPPGTRPVATAETERAGAGEAVLKERSGTALDELFAGAESRADRRGLWLALDHLQDPHNVGAVFRSAAFFGVEGVVLTRDRSAPLNATVYDVSAGGVEHVPFSVQTNLARALDAAKQAGLWILGSSEHAETDVNQVQRDRPWLLVLGSEEKGLRRLTQKKCDTMCRITPKGHVTSLNVSVAAGILMAALTRV